MTDTYVRVTRQDSILFVTLDQPARRNAYDGPGLKALADAFSQLDSDAGLRVGVITGAGGHFCSGADIASAAGGGFDDPPYPRVANGLATKPVVAAIDGPCLGGGLMIATGADIRVGAAGSTYGIPEARWNLPSPWLAALSRQIRPSDAMHLALLADETFSAAHMQAIGFLHEVVDDGPALDRATVIARRISQLAPAALSASKQLIIEGHRLELEAAAELGEERARALSLMNDTAEAASAFAERRSPRFTGR